jgi:hypothetical protein
MSDLPAHSAWQIAAIFSFVTAHCLLNFCVNKFSSLKSFCNIWIQNFRFLCLVIILNYYFLLQFSVTVERCKWIRALFLFPSARLLFTRYKCECKEEKCFCFVQGAGFIAMFSHVVQGHYKRLQSSRCVSYVFSNHRTVYWDASQKQKRYRM